MDDPDPQVRAAAAGNLQGAPAQTLLRLLPPLLEDPVRLVRTEAARVLAAAPSTELDGRQRQALRKALDEFKEGVLVKDTAGQVIRITPPLVITQEECEWGIERIAKVLA